MELKFDKAKGEIEWTEGFNRTFMELKSELMDWFPERSYSFNRTFMELKYIINRRTMNTHKF